MDSLLSAYWVQFFKNAGFPSDVATRHAVIFSNNRIKPDMLPDLDKPSLREMGITLMGDMIAILRYAKKVVEENTCKKFLVSSEDSPTTVKTVVKPTIKKVTKTVTKTVPKVKVEVPTKTIKTSSFIVKPTVTLKKKIQPITQTSRLYSDYIDTNQRPKINSLKRKYDSDEEDINGKWLHNEDKRVKTNTNNIEYKVIMPKVTTVQSQKILKKALEQKRTVFHRLGDSMVTSTTSIVESSNSDYNPTFNVTGVGKDVFKRNASVFNRLGNKDNEKRKSSFSLHSRNGNVSSVTPSILKTHSPMLGTKLITTKTLAKKPVGTMRADEEANKKSISQNVRELVKTSPNFKYVNNSIRSSNLIRKIPVTGKLASERLSVPAKSRLGVSKQVTFNNMATINHIRKQGVFSRLGV